MTKKIINDLDIEKLNSEYEQGQPFKYVVIDNFFKEEIAKELAGQFPNYDDDKVWKIYKKLIMNEMKKTVKNIRKNLIKSLLKFRTKYTQQ